MAKEYKKTTKDDIDFPRYCLFFISKLNEAIKDRECNDFRFFNVEILTHYPYCSEAFELIGKTLEKKGFEVSTPGFKTETIDDIKCYRYRWRLRRATIVNDDLPF